MAVPSQTPTLPFIWRDFEYGRPGNCFGACVIMCCRYWVRHDPSLDLPLSIKDLEERLGESYFSRSGLSVERLRQALKKEEIEDLDGERIVFGLDVEIRTLKNMEGLYPFLHTIPPTPIIISFDKGYAEKNIPSGQHAVLLHSLDYGREFISVIDPVKLHLKKPFPYDFKVFEAGWDRSDNMIFIAAPIDRLKLISGEKVKVVRQVPLTQFRSRGVR